MSWWIKNKVLIIGLLSAIAITAYDLISSGGNPSWKMIITSCMVAGAGFLSRNLRGQSASIVGIIGVVGVTIVNDLQTGRSPNWTQIILQAVILFLAAVAAPAKSTGYEHAPVIEDAKKQGEDVQPTAIGSKGN